jgi:hypothetical protein
MPNRATPKGKVPGVFGIGGWIDPSTGLDALEKRVVLPLLDLEPRFFCRPSRNIVGLDSTRPLGLTS